MKKSIAGTDGDGKPNNGGTERADGQDGTTAPLKAFEELRRIIARLERQTRGKGRAAASAALVELAGIVRRMHAQIEGGCHE